MKLSKHDNNFKSNIDNMQSQEFGIGDIAPIIDILRNRLYKNKIPTLVQEYICNGRDAMREVDSDKNIELTAPTRLSPTFKVRDYGPGISEHRMSNVFLNYGSSTKRIDNVQTGGFGIGAKSAFAYTDSFTVITYIDGTKRTYIAHTGANNNGRMDLISTINTNECDGTEINIAINPQDITKFQEAINRCVFFWTKGYIIKGMDLPIVHTKGTMFNKYLEIEVTGEFLPSISDRYGNDLVCSIDGIPYKLTSFRDKIDSLHKIETIVNGTFVIHLPNGLVEVSANREEISDSKHTMKNLTKLLDNIYKELDSHIKKQFANVKNTYEYIDAFNSYSGKFNLNSYKTFGDYNIENNNDFSSSLFTNVKFFKVSIDRKGKFIKQCVNTDTRSHYNRSKFLIHITQRDRLFYNTGESAVIVGKRLRQYLEINENCILIENSGDAVSFNKLVKDLDFKCATTIKLPTKLKSTKIKRSAKQVCIHEYTRWGRKSLYTTLDTNDTMWYYIKLEGSTLPPSMYKERILVLERFFDVRICGLSKNNVNLVKDDENFELLDTLIESFKPTNGHLGWYKQTMQINSSEFNTIKGLTGVKNKKIQSLIKLYQEVNRQGTARLSDNLPDSLIKKVAADKSVVKFVKQDAKLAGIFDDFPLLKSLSYVKDDAKDDMVIYINAKTCKLQKGIK